MPARSVMKAKAPTFAAVVNRPMGALDHNLNRRAGKAQRQHRFLSRYEGREPLLGGELWLVRLARTQERRWLSSLTDVWARLRCAARWSAAGARHCRAR